MRPDTPQLESPPDEPTVATAAEIAENTAATLATIGLRIREARNTRNMTLQSLAAASGLSTSMLSLVERGRASPSIGSLIVIASALGITMSELVASEPTPDEKLVVRAGEPPAIETAQHVIRRLMRDDRARGVTVAVNEYQPRTGSNDRPVTHSGFEYGYVLEGRLTVEVDGAVYILNPGDLISYLSQRPHRIWNHGTTVVRTLWFNIDRQ
ncbi:helix-turn-helix domain-containing protein [Methylorubrum zatmanii]